MFSSGGCTRITSRAANVFTKCTKIASCTATSGVRQKLFGSEQTSFSCCLFSFLQENKTICGNWCIFAILYHCYGCTKDSRGKNKIWILTKALQCVKYHISYLEPQIGLCKKVDKDFYQSWKLWHHCVHTLAEKWSGPLHPLAGGVGGVIIIVMIIEIPVLIWQTFFLSKIKWKTNH